MSTQEKPVLELDEDGLQKCSADAGTLHRGLKARQITMITLGGSLGTGLIIASGTALTRGGPVGLVVGYTFMGIVCYFVMVALAEMSAYIPHRKGLGGYSTRFVDPAFGFALGWNYLFKYFFQTANNVNAAGIVMQYWTLSVPIEVWMIVFISAIFLVNLLGVRFFGEFEFVFSSIKVTALVGLILMGFIIDLGGNPSHDRYGFRYWKPPYGPLGEYLINEVHSAHLAKFLGFWSTLITALFSYIGIELIGITAGEAQNPQKTMPRAIRATFFRILVFYVGGSFSMSLTVPSTNQSLFVANSSKAGAAASPFLVAASLAGIHHLDSVINAIVLIFVLSASNSDLYIGSRTLYALAVEKKAPAIFARVNKRGVPWPALALCTAVCFLTFLNASSSSSIAFAWFSNLVASLGAITWICIPYTHIAFMRALRAQGIPRESLPYKAPLQPYGSWFALVSTSIVLIFNGFSAFLPFALGTFITSYIGIPLFALLWGGYKIFYRTARVPAISADTVSDTTAPYRTPSRKREATLNADGAANAPEADGDAGRVLRSPRRVLWRRLWGAL